MDDDERITRAKLARLSEQVSVDDPRRPALENLDAIAQMAVDRVMYYEGEAYPAPELQTAIKAQIAMMAALVPEFEAARAKQPGNINSIVEAIRKTAIDAARLRLLEAPIRPKQGKGQAE
jgi:hypothetical protein